MQLEIINFTHISPDSQTKTEVIHMKLCLKEIMKRIALLDQQKSEILSDEAQNCTTTYGLGEERLPTEYDFASTRAAVKVVDDKVRYLRHQLNLANATVASLMGRFFRDALRNADAFARLS